MGIFKLEKIEVTYGTGNSAVSALRGIDLQIKEGEKIAIVGPSGSGKSTLLNVLGGLEKPTNGKYLYKGQEYYNLKQSRQSDIRLKEFGFVFQSFYLVSSLTVKDNILLPMVADKRKTDDKFLDDVVNRLGIAERMTHFPNELSGGEKQRVAIARAIINKPGVIFADEPSGNLDSVTGENVFELLFEVANNYKQTLIYVTHDLEKAKLAQRIITIKDGEIYE